MTSGQRNRIEGKQNMKTGRKKFGCTDLERKAIDMVRLASRKVRGGRVPTLQSIADKLNAAGFVTKAGKAFRPQTISSIQGRIARGDFKAMAKRIKKTQLASGDFRTEHQILNDRVRLKMSSPKFNSESSNIYEVLLGTGLRASELCDLRCSDIDINKRMVNVRRGKGSKQRTIIISKETAYLFTELIYCRPKRNHIFANRFGAKLSYGALRSRGKKIADIIGDPSWHLHCMRHTFATRLYNYKKDINFVAEQLSHSSIETTRIYAKTLSKEKLEQMDAMDSLGKSTAKSASTPETTSKPSIRP